MSKRYEPSIDATFRSLTLGRGGMKLDAGVLAMLLSGGGSVYFVDGNSGDDNNPGNSLVAPYKTLAAAAAVSHADIARGSDRWARRNTIFIAGDSLTENLVALPQKTDIIGIGSCDAYSMATIKGNHAPINAALGCRFYNVRFKPATNAVIWTLTAANNGVKFIDCQGVGVESGVTATSFIATTAVELLEISGCEFVGAFSDKVINIGAGNASGLKIVDNYIHGGASDGIYINTGATFLGVGGKAVIDNNRVYVALVTINDVSQLALVTRNRCISAAASGTGGVGAFVANAHLCSDNQITAAGITFMYPLAFDADGTT